MLIPRRDVATLLSISLRKVDELIREGVLPVRRIGRRVLVPRSALVKFVGSALTQE